MKIRRQERKYINSGDNKPKRNILYCDDEWKSNRQNIIGKRLVKNIIGSINGAGEQPKGVVHIASGTGKSKNIKMNKLTFF